MDNTEVDIIKIEIDQSQALKNLEQTERALSSLKDEQKKLNDELKKGTITQDEYIKSKVQLDSKLRSENENRKTLIKTIDTESNSLAAQRLKLAEMIKTRDQMDRSTKEGTLAFNKQNAAINELSKSIGESEQAGNSFQRNVGNYKGALDKISGGAYSSAEGLATMTKSSVAFISTPIGATLTAIGVTLAALISYFKHTGEGEDQLAKASAQLDAVLSDVIDTLSELGQMIANADTSQGGFGKFLAFLKEVNPLTQLWRLNMAGVKLLFGDTVKAAGDLADRLDAVDDRERAYNAAASDTANVIKELIIQSKNRTLSEDERSAKLTQATDLERKQTEEIVAIKNERLAIEVAQVELGNKRLGLQKNENETLQEYALRLINNSQIADAYKDKLSTAYQAVNDAQSQSITILEKAANAQDALDQKQEQSAQKHLDDLHKQLDEDEKIRSEHADRVAALAAKQAQSEAKAEKEKYDKEHGYLTSFASNFKAAQDGLKKQREAGDKAAKSSGEISKHLTEQQQLEQLELVNVLEMAAGLFGKNTIAYKLIASARAIMNTELAITQALASAPPPFDIIEAGVVGAIGAASIAKIAGVKFSQGGFTGPGGKFQPAGIVHAGEVVWNQEDVSAVGGPSAANSMRPTFGQYSDGGVVSSSAASQVNNRIDAMNLKRDFPPIYTSIKEINDMNASLKQKSQIVNV